MPQKVEKEGDCLSCRVINAVVFVGVSVYLASALWKSPAPVGLHRGALILSSAGCLGLGVYRAVA